MAHYEVWQFLAGLGFFLYGMNLLENVLKNISGRRLKFFLKRNTQNLFKAILGGTVITGIIQSSSVVSLIVLAFVEAGIVQFRNALAVILGANLGTTLSSWLVTFVGFKLDVLEYAMPVIAITAISMFFLENRKRLYSLCAIFFALGILFIGLDFMKKGALVMVGDFDLIAYAEYSPLFFVLIGFVLTTIIQSSSATVAITLTAIYVEAITLPCAAAVVIGSEVGTTIKILLWGMKGSADKKRVAWGNFIYNIFTSVVAFLSLGFLLQFFQKVLQIQDPLISLVMFQSSINIIAITLFVPFLHSFSNWLERTFRSHDAFSSAHWSRLLPMVMLEEVRKEVIRLLVEVRRFNHDILCDNQSDEEGLIENIKSLTEESFDSSSRYQYLKRLEGRALACYAQARDCPFNMEDAQMLLQYVQAVRLCIYSAKAVKDVEHNMRELESSINTSFYQQRVVIQRQWDHFDNSLNELIEKSEADIGAITEVELLIDEERFQYQEKVKAFTDQMEKGELTSIEASTLMNVYREILSSKKSLLRAVHYISGVIPQEQSAQAEQSSDSHV